MNGIIPVWKERGLTSHDVVYKLRKILKTKKVGHSGTLDPDVAGVLPIGVGKGTKLLSYLQASQKSYQGEITLGYSTTTEDASGEMVSEKAVTVPIADQTIDQVMASFLGSSLQTPPMYSAVKIKGRRLYEYARAGETIERPSRPIEIYSFDRLAPSQYDPSSQRQTWPFEVCCGKGTYVRTLAVDTGLRLGYPAHMSKLTRIASGGFTQTDCFSLAELTALQAADDQSFLFPLARAVEALPRMTVSEEMWQEVRHGKVLTSHLFQPYLSEAEVALFYQNELVSIYSPHPTKAGYWKPTKVFKNE